MFKRGGGEPDISNGAVQRGMREEIVGRLDKIIDNWDPAFAKLASDTKLASDLARDAELALEALKQARSELSGMIFPRTDRAVGSCYQSLLEPNGSFAESARADVVCGRRKDLFGGGCGPAGCQRLVYVELSEVVLWI